MSYADQNDFFAQAYRTGTDTWTNIPFTRHAHELTLYIPKGSMVLDLGAGRGRTMYTLADLGFRVIGLENNEELVSWGNGEIKIKGRERELRYLHGDVLNIPFADQSFDAVVDVGLSQHLLPKDHNVYVEEISRVLKQGAFFFLITLSKTTKQYFNWTPNESPKSDFDLEGVHYHFFSEEEIRSLFGKDFDIKHVDYDTPFGPEDTVYTVVLLRKK